MRATRIRPLTAALPLALATLAGAPLLADDGPARGGDDPADVLGGPEVEDRDVPGTSDSFGETMMRAPGDRSARVPHRVFMGAVEALDAPDTDPALRVTDDQRAVIEDAVAAFRDELRAYMREHADELRALRGARGRGGDGGRGAGDRRRADDVSDEDRRRLRELMQSAPQPDDAHTLVWAALTEPQRAFVTERLEAAQDRQMGGPAGAPGGAPADEATAERWRAIGARIQRLPPEARERIMRRLESMLDRIEENPDGPPPERRRGRATRS